MNRNRDSARREREGRPRGNCSLWNLRHYLRAVRLPRQTTRSSMRHGRMVSSSRNASAAASGFTDGDAVTTNAARASSRVAKHSVGSTIARDGARCSCEAIAPNARSGVPADVDVPCRIRGQSAGSGVARPREAGLRPRRSVRLTYRVHTNYACTAALIGIPLGLVAGRWAWSAVASARCIDRPTADVLTVVLVAAGLITLANLIALVPRRWHTEPRQP